MNILVISDYCDKSKLVSELKKFIKKNNYNIKAYNVEKDSMHYCTGCFSCWLKTPGQCVFNDISNDINKAYIESDIAIILSPVKYGCYTTAIRRTLDRMLPNILPFFKKINGEVHHAPRYNKYPKLVTIGHGSNITLEEENTFKALSNANAVNFQVSKAEVYIIREESEINDMIKSLGVFIKECEVK